MQGESVVTLPGVCMSMRNECASRQAVSFRVGAWVSAAVLSGYRVNREDTAMQQSIHGAIQIHAGEPRSTICMQIMAVVSGQSKHGHKERDTAGRCGESKDSIISPRRRGGLGLNTRLSREWRFRWRFSSMAIPAAPGVRYQRDSWRAAGTAGAGIV